MPKKYKRYCNDCGKYYEGGGSKFCSPKCGKSGSFNPFFKKSHSKITKQKIAKSRIGKSTGSGIHHWNWQGKSLPRKCIDCGKEINYRSTRCYVCANSGDKSPQWRGGLTDLRTQIWKTKEYREWRKQVFERDKFTCRHCNKTKCWIESHHIKSFAEYPALRFIVKNGITLCKKCHKLAHTGVPKPKYA